MKVSRPSLILGISMMIIGAVIAIFIYSTAGTWERFDGVSVFVRDPLSPIAFAGVALVLIGAACIKASIDTSK